MGIKHGHRSEGFSKTYNSWRKMKERCNNPNHKSYSEYGGRGIRVNPNWDKFEVFLRDMGEQPDGQTLDRIDVNGDYEVSNCRWATISDQNKNQRRWYN